MKPDKITAQWMADESDVLAVHNGCKFDEERGQFAVDWMHDYLVLYEGVWAGKPFTCQDWQYDGVMRLFGWVRPNVDWKNEIDSPYIRRFRQWIVFIAKKNKKSPTLAAVMLYMLCGDGVQGQKCFPGAKDGTQIRQNVMRHVMEMVRQSPALDAECKINLNEASVTHIPTRSALLPLSSSNVRTEKSKEGLNGSTFIDEVHVVDESFVRRIDRAGISRPEPLHVEVSTAGDDIDSYGYKRFQYAEGVIDGTIKDDATLAMVYSAPQNLTDEQLEADPLKYGRLANPSFGHTVKESEFLADYARSKTTLRGLADFKMYRLNVWQHTATPWLDMAAWDQCGDEVDFRPADPIYGGLDLSSKRDFTAWRMVQDQDGVIVTKGHAWLTELRARQHSDAGLPVYDWQRDGWLTICPGERIDYVTMMEHIEEDAQTYGIETIGFDPWQAETVRQMLGDNNPIRMIEVTQGYRAMSDPSKELEAAVAAREIYHGGDPCLRWMAKNSTVKCDNKDNIFPIKPDRAILKAIDGIVALVMALHMMRSVEPQSVSVFDTEWDF